MVWGFGLGVWDLGRRVQGLGLRAKGLGVGLMAQGFRDRGLGGGSGLRASGRVVLDSRDVDGDGAVVRHRDVRVPGVGFTVEGLVTVDGVGFMVEGLGFRIAASGCGRWSFEEAGVAVREGLRCRARYRVKFCSSMKSTSAYVVTSSV